MTILNMETIRPKISIDERQYKRLFAHIQREIRNGEGVKKIADDLGITGVTVTKILQENGTSVDELNAKRYGKKEKV